MERKKDNKRKKDSSFLKSLTDWDLTLLLMENLETNLALNNQNHAIYEGFFNDLNTILIEYIDEQNRKNSTDIKLDRFRLKTLQYTNNKLENQNYNHEKIYNDNITMYNTIIDLWKRLGNEQNQKPNDDAITNLQEKIKKFTDTENILTNQQIAVLINFRNNLMSFTREGIVYIPSLSHSIKKYAVNTDGTLNKTNFEKILKFNQNISNLDIKTFNDTLASINVELLDEKALEIRKQTQQQQQNQQQIQSNLTTSLYNQSIQFQPQQQQFQLQQQFQQQNDNFYSFGAGQSSLQNNSSISFDLSNSDNNQQSMPIQQQQFQLQQQKIKPQNDFNSSLKFSQQEQSLQQQNQQQIQVEDDNHDIPEEGVTSRIINKKNGFQTMSTVKVGDTFIKQMLGKLGEQSSTIQTQQQKIKNLENQLNQKNSKQIKLSMVQEENEEIDVDYYYTLIAENQQLRAENEKLTQENKKLTTHNTALTQKNKELEKQNKNLETEITNFKQQGSFRKKNLTNIQPAQPMPQQEILGIEAIKSKLKEYVEKLDTTFINANNYNKKNQHITYDDCKLYYDILLKAFSNPQENPYIKTKISSKFVSFMNDIPNNKNIMDLLNQFNILHAQQKQQLNNPNNNTNNLNNQYQKNY